MSNPHQPNWAQGFRGKSGSRQYGTLGTQSIRKGFRYTKCTNIYCDDSLCPSGCDEIKTNLTANTNCGGENEMLFQCPNDETCINLYNVHNETNVCDGDENLYPSASLFNSIQVRYILVYTVILKRISGL